MKRVTCDFDSVVSMMDASCLLFFGVLDVADSTESFEVFEPIWRSDLGSGLGS